MKHVNLFFLALLLLVCTACPYQSAVPVDEAKIAVNEAMFGKWKADPKSKDFIEIAKQDDNTYLVTETAFKVDGISEKKVYAAHLSELDGQQYMNVKILRSGNTAAASNDFFIYKIVVEGTDKFRLVPITENIKEKFNTSAELQDFIRRYKDLSFFFEEELVYQRAD